MTPTQVPERFLNVLTEQERVFSREVSVTVQNSIPPSKDIPLENQTHWIRIPSVICVFVDMRGSTGLSAQTKDRTTAAAYQLFTGTATKLLVAFDAAHIDIKGDGVFALFDGSQPHRALAAAVTFRTFCSESIVPKIRDKTGVNIGNHIGIDSKGVLVRRIGLRRRIDGNDRENEVWAGKPVNMAARLASEAGDSEILVSSRFHALLTRSHAVLSCGCSGGRPGGARSELWTERAVSASLGCDFDVIKVLGSTWCGVHGAEYCEALLEGE